MTGKVDCIKLLEALNKARAEFKPIQMTGYNPIYNSHYATRQDIINATNEALTKNGLSIMHIIETTDDITKPVLVTRLYHISGEYIESRYPLDFSGFESGRSYYQQQGSALTYAMRYSHTAILCISAEEEDDANIADNVKAKLKVQGSPIKKIEHQKKEEPEKQENETKVIDEEIINEIAIKIGMTVEELDNYRKLLIGKYGAEEINVKLLLGLQRREETLQKISKITGIKFKDLTEFMKKITWQHAEIINKMAEMPREAILTSMRELEVMSETKI